MRQWRQSPFVQVLQGMYWTWHKDRNARRHLLFVVFRAAANLLRLRAWSLFSRDPFVAIALTEHMGDIMAAEPLSRRARATFPNARIHWVTSRPYLPLVERYPSLTGAVRVTCLTEWMLLWHGGVADVAWDLHLNGRFCPRCKVPLEKQGKAARATFYNYYDFGSLLAVQCISAGLDPIDDSPVLLPDQDAARVVDGLDLPNRFVVIHCAANDPLRDWVKDKWATLVRHVTDRLGIAVVEVGLASVVVERDTDLSRSLCGALSIAQTAEVIRRAALFVGVDSGPAHIANAVGTQGVILIGHLYGFIGHMPYSGWYATEAGAMIVRMDGPLASLPIEPVIEAVDARLGSRPPAPSADGVGGVGQATR